MPDVPSQHAPLHGSSAHVLLFVYLPDPAPEMIHEFTQLDCALRDVPVLVTV
jgi:hypothetical protein